MHCLHQQNTKIKLPINKKLLKLGNAVWHQITPMTISIPEHNFDTNMYGKATKPYYHGMNLTGGKK